MHMYIIPFPHLFTYIMFTGSGCHTPQTKRMLTRDEILQVANCLQNNDANMYMYYMHTYTGNRKW